MDYVIWISTFILLGIVGTVTLIANQSERRQNFRPIAKAAIFVLIFMAIGNRALEVVYLIGDNEIKQVNGAVSMIMMLAVSVLATLFLYDPFRIWVARFFPQAESIPKMKREELRYIAAVPSELGDLPVIYADAPLAPIPAQESRYERLGFRPESLVHALAAVLILLFFGQNISSYFQAGGLSGIAEDLAVDYDALYSNFVMMLLLSLMGVGLFIRRSPRETMQRLGLTGVGIKEIAVAFGSTFVVLVALFAIAIVWSLIVGMETYEKQNEASSALAESVNTMGMAFAIAFTAAVWEEIAFRGALQPIFGLAPTAVIFALIHIQYTLTPATLIILMVAVVLGFIRRYFNTTTAILVHFLYNFVQLALTVQFADEIESFIHHIL